MYKDLVVKVICCEFLICTLCKFSTGPILFKEILLNTDHALTQFFFVHNKVFSFTKLLNILVETRGSASGFGIALRLLFK